MARKRATTITNVYRILDQLPKLELVAVGRKKWLVGNFIFTAFLQHICQNDTLLTLAFCGVPLNVLQCVSNSAHSWNVTRKYQRDPRPLDNLPSHFPMSTKCICKQCDLFISSYRWFKRSAPNDVMVQFCTQAHFSGNCSAMSLVSWRWRLECLLWSLFMHRYTWWIHFRIWQHSVWMNLLESWSICKNDDDAFILFKLWRFQEKFRFDFTAHWW